MSVLRKGETISVTPETMAIIAPVAIEASRGLGTLGTMMIEASDRIAPILSDLKGTSPEPIDVETRDLMTFAADDIRKLATFISRPVSLDSLRALEVYYQTSNLGDLASRTAGLTSEPFKRAMILVLGERGDLWGSATDRLVKTRIMGIPAEVLALVRENPQIRGHLIMAGWWAECLRNAQEVYDFALNAMEEHLNSSDRSAGQAKELLANFESSREVMTQVGNQMTATVQEGMEMNLVSTDHDSNQQTEAMRRVAQLLEQTAINQRAYSTASTQALRASLTMDSLRANIGMSQARHKAYLNLLLASSRWVSASERGTLATLNSVNIVLMASVADAINLRGVRAGEMAGRIEGMLSKALVTAGELTSGQVSLVKDVVSATRKDFGKPSEEEVIEGKFRDA